MDYIAAAAWILLVLFIPNGFLFLGARWERERNARIIRTLQRHGVPVRRRR